MAKCNHLTPLPFNGLTFCNMWICRSSSLKIKLFSEHFSTASWRMWLFCFLIRTNTMYIMKYECTELWQRNCAMFHAIQNCSWKQKQKADNMSRYECIHHFIHFRLNFFIVCYFDLEWPWLNLNWHWRTKTVCGCLSVYSLIYVAYDVMF